MSELYRLEQVASINGQSDFGKDPVLIADNLSYEMAHRLGKALVEAEDRFAGKWAEKGGAWYRGSKLVLKCTATTIPDEIGYLEEALKITGGGGDRETSYGHPITNFSGIAILWSVWLTQRGKLLMGMNLDNEDVAMMNILQKVSRQANAPKRDNWVDIAGYVNTASRMNEVTKEERKKKASPTTGKWIPSLQDLWSWLRR